MERELVLLHRAVRKTPRRWRSGAQPAPSERAGPSRSGPEQVRTCSGIQSRSSTSTAGRSRTSSLVKLSRTPSSTSLTAPIGMATRFWPQR